MRQASPPPPHNQLRIGASDTRLGIIRRMYTIYDVILLIPLGLFGFYWWRTSEQKRIAVAAARTYCKDRELQLLDETLVFKQHRIEKEIRRPPANALPSSASAPVQLQPRRRLCRVYEFDYSRAGQDRHTGEIIMSGYRVLRVILHSQVLEITNY